MKDFLILLILISAPVTFAWSCGEEDKLKEARSVRPGDKAPPFGGVWVLNGKTEEICSEKLNQEYTILIFYPFDFTYVCPTELLAFSDNIEKFDELKVQIIGISTDSHHTHLAWTKTSRDQGGVSGLKFPLLSDIDKSISKEYGVLVDDKSNGIYGAALRGLFIIDGKGTIRSMHINDAPVGRSVEETLRLIEAFKYTDTHGEVCPAGWKPGKPTMVPDFEGKLKYFEDEKQKGDL